MKSWQPGRSRLASAVTSSIKTHNLTDDPLRRSPVGQEDQFRPPSLSGRCAFAEETFARTHRKEEDAPTAGIRATAREPPGSLRLLGRLPLKIDAARSGGRRPRSLDGGNRGPGWRVGAAPAAYLWGFEIGA